jgi:hypothetical protein
MTTIARLSDIQVQRAEAFPAKFADNPLRAVLLDGLQRRNAILDAVFYDIGVVTEAESPDLAFWLAREGAVVLVPPTGAGRAEVFLSAARFLASQKPAAALAVAGVGSSALGAAAFARNVADAIGAPVAAVVSGYGLADVLTEAFGGYVWFGGLNSIRHLFEPLDQMTKQFTRTEAALEASAGAVWARTSRDTETVLALLSDDRFKPDLVIGHSKGNLVISEALFALLSEQPSLSDRIAELRIVTVSAKIGMPRQGRRVFDVMGEWDAFGALNSRPDIRSDYVVPGAWHSTNRDFPFAMGIPVTAMLRTVLPIFDSGIRLDTAGSHARLLDAPQRMTAALRSLTAAPKQAR